MISTHPTTETFEPVSVKLLAPLYDTVKGKPVYFPMGYGVRVLSKAAPGFYNIIGVDSTGKTRKALATHVQLFNTPVTTPEEPTFKLADNLILVDHNPDVEQEQIGPLVPRIYQEYGITFLLYKGKAILADAPGVGKTLQALEAAYRVCLAQEQHINPLELCYQQDLTNLHDEKNTHPTTRPEWAIPEKPRHSITSYSYGKTKLNVATHNPYYWPTHMKPVVVIVAPSHLCSMWFKAILKQYPNEHVSIATNDTRTNRMAVLQPGCRFYIVNYEMMRKAPEPKDTDYTTIKKPTTIGGITYNIDFKELRSDYVKPTSYLDVITAMNPVCVVMDESHRLKSHKSKQAKATAEFAHQALYRFELTATPIKREADDLFWQLHILDPERFVEDEYTNFITRYCFYKQTEYGKKNIQLRDASKRQLWFNRIPSLEEAFNQTNVMPEALFGTKKSSTKYINTFTEPNLKGYILGRSYADVGLYLPPVMPATIPVNMDSTIRALYDNLKKTYRATFDMLGESITVTSMIGMIHSLRILTACPNKYEAVQEIIDDNDGPFCIFCEYKPSGEHLAKMLDTTFISGEIPEAERETLIASLISQGKPIVGMGRVIGTGINALNVCNVIINFENDYTPGERTQRIGRVQRFSPTRPEGQPILLFDVLVTDSIDQHVYEVQKNRGKSIKDIITVELGMTK